MSNFTFTGCDSYDGNNTINNSPYIVTDKNLAKALSFVQGITCGTLVIIFAATFVHVKRGTNYNTVLLLLMMLLVSNVSGVGVAFADYQLNVLRKFTQEAWVWMYGICFGIYFLMFNMSH
jgi:predicted membrane protein